MEYISLEYISLKVGEGECEERAKKCSWNRTRTKYMIIMKYIRLSEEEGGNNYILRKAPTCE